MADGALYTYVTTTGTIIPDTADIKADVQSEWRQALGEDLDTSDSTPQGVLIVAETSARSSVAANNATLANQINPNLSGGVYLDAICALTGLERDEAKRTTVAGVVLSGVPLTPIPEGAIAKTSAGDQFASASAVSIGTNGAATVDFAAVEYGAVPCPADGLTGIVTAVLGWESVTNPIAGVLGRAEQSDQDLRALRRKTMALQGVSLPEAITSAVYDIEGVSSLKFRENISSTLQTIDGVTMAPHSIYMCVRGGTDSDIGAALLGNKSLGCGYNHGPGVNHVTVNVVEASSGQTYGVKFDRPNDVPVLIKAYVRANTSLIDPQTAVRSAIMAFAAGEIEGEDGFVVGGDVSPFELAGAISVKAPGVFVSKVEVARLSDGIFATDIIPIDIWQQATTTESSIQVVQL